MSEEKQIAINRIQCDGSRLCAELAPELIQLDDWGYPIIAPGPVPHKLLGTARRAVKGCPRLALELRDLDVARQRPQRPS